MSQRAHRRQSGRPVRRPNPKTGVTWGRVTIELRGELGGLQDVVVEYSPGLSHLTVMAAAGETLLAALEAASSEAMRQDEAG